MIEYNNKQKKQAIKKKQKKNIINTRSRHQRCSMFSKISQNTQENTCARVSARVACNFIKKQILTRVFSCEFCEISKSTFFTEYLRTTALEYIRLHLHIHVKYIMKLNNHNQYLKFFMLF